jgi:hypothetical protein
MPATTYYKNAIINWLFGKSSSGVPANMYFGLSTTPVTDVGWSSVTEPNTGSYDRIIYANDKTIWGMASDGIVSNILPITFPTCTNSWGTILSLFIIAVDYPTSGSVLWYTTLATPIIVTTGKTVTFAPGIIVATL